MPGQSSDSHQVRVDFKKCQLFHLKVSKRYKYHKYTFLLVIIIHFFKNVLENRSYLAQNISHYHATFKSYNLIVNYFIKVCVMYYVALINFISINFHLLHQCYQYEHEDQHDS